MANSNVDITNKIFAYVKHGKDINQPIKDVYKNSLIFIGDESQLYVPAIDTYVGIGETRFNDVLNNTIWERGEGEVSAQVRFTGSRALGSYSIAEGKETLSMAFSSHTEGYKTITGGEYVSNPSDTTEGINVPGSFAHAEGRATIACGDIGAHAEGNKTLASGRASHAEGNKTVASGVYAHAEGASVYAAGSTSHAEGQHTYSMGMFSHAENIITYAQGKGSHSEGVFTYAVGDYSHSQGDITFAISYVSNATGLKTVAYGMASSSFGNGGCPIIISGEANSLNYTFKLSEGPIFTAYEHLNQNTFKELFLSNTQIYINGDYEHTHKKITNVTNIRKSGGSLTGTITLEETLSDTAINNISYEILSHIAFGRASTITGVTNITYGEASHAEGNSNFAYGPCSHVEGQQTKAIGDNAHAEGNNTIANGNDSHAEGYVTKAQSPYSHAEGINTTASDLQAHAEGNETEASGQSAHAEGFNSEASGNNSHAEGESTASGRSAHSEGTATASAQNSHAEGTGSTASGKSSHAEGESTTASAIRSHAEGYQSKASGQASHAEGNNSNATKDNSHSEGQNTYANGANSHAEGVGTYAQASQSHAEGNQTVAAANRSHAEGYRTYAAGNPSHAEGSNTYAIGMGAHSEGWLTYAYGNDSHAEGALSYAIGDKSHVEGEWTYTYNSYEHAQGLYNLSHTKEDEEFGYCYNTIHTIGIGTGNEDRKNAFTIMQNGDMYVYNIGNYDGTNPEEAETFQDRFNRTNIWERGEGEFGAQTIGTGSNAEGAYSIAAGYFAYAYGSRQGAVALGYYTTAYDRGSFAEGWLTYALKGGSHAEGQNTYALAQASHAEGRITYAYGTGSHAEGVNTIAYGQSSHAEGQYTYTYEYASHAEGGNTTAYGVVSHAEGGNTIAYGIGSHVEGQYTYAYGISSHAEGTVSYAIGHSSHAENYKTYAYGSSSHAEGISTISYGFVSHVEGGNFAFSISLSGSNDVNNIYTGTQSKSHFDLFANGRIDLQTQKEIIKKSFIISDDLIPVPVKIIDCEITENNESLLFTITTEKPLTSDNLINHDTLISAAISIGNNSHSEGKSISYGDTSHSEGTGTLSFGTNSHAEGQTTYAGGIASHAEGINTNANGDYSHAEGAGTYVSGIYSHAEGHYTYALGLGAHAEGEYTYSYHYASHAEGFATEAIGWGSHAEGGMPEDMSLESVEGAHTTAFGISSHAEGLYTMAYGNYSHTEGWGSYTIGNYSHAEGRYTYAANNASHAEGRYTYAYGDSSHAEGAGTYTLEVASHAEGLSTYTYNASEHAQGQFNKAHKASNNFGDSYNSIHTIGIGTDDDNRKNAVTIMQNGDMYLYGVADYDGTNPEEATSLQQYFEETEYVISQALNDLHDNINSHELNIPQLPEQGDERFAYLLTGVSTEDGVSLSHTISYQVTGIPTKKYIDELIEANDALRYCGTVTVSAEENGAFTLTHNPSAAPGHGTVTPDTTRGAVYKVTNIGFFGTQRVSPGDMIISYTDTTTASSFEGWDVINENIDLRQLKRSAVNGKAVVTNVELTADGTFSYTYSNLAVSNSGTLSMAGFAMAQGGPDSAHVNISGFSDFDNVLDVDDAGGEPAQVISRGVRVLTNVSLSQTNLTTKLTYSYSYIYADTSHHRTRTGFNNGDIALGLEGVNVITGAYLTHKGTFAYSYSRIYVADSEHANEADTLTGIDAVELNSYTHSVGNIYIDPTTNHVTYSYINLSGNTGSYISDIIPAQNDRLHKVITGINQRGDGKISYAYSYIETESIWERGTGEFSAQLKGTNSSATGMYSVAEGNFSTASGSSSHVEGVFSTASGMSSHAEGENSVASGDNSHAEGYNSESSGFGSHAEGGYSRRSGGIVIAIPGGIASGNASHAEGIQTTASNDASHAEGQGTYALGMWAHAEGYYTYAYDWACHAEGFGTKAIGPCSHAEGGLPEDMLLESVEDTPTTAFGISSHAEGLSTMAYGDYSHAEGLYSYSVGFYSHAEGNYTYTYNDAEHAEGSYNKSTPGVTLHSIGIGTDHNNRKNAFEITNTGAAYLFGVGNYNGDNINSAKSLQQYFQDTEYVISSAINDLNDRVNTNEDVMYNSLFSKFEIVNNTISAKIGNVEKSVSVTYTPYSYALSSYTYFWGQPFNGTTNVEGNMINIGYAYTSGNIVITKAAYHKEFNGIVVETNSGRDICFGVGTGGNNRGIYDIDQEGWMIYNSTDTNNVAYTFLPNYNIRIGATDAPRVKLDVNGDISTNKLYLGKRVDSSISSSDTGTMSFYLANGSYTLTFTSNGTPPGSTACLRPGWDNQNVEFALGQEARPWKIAYISYLYSTITNDYPIRVSSNKMNPNLNADLLDGKHLNQVFDSLVFDTTSKKLKATVGGVEKEVTISGADTLNTPRNFRVSDNTAAHQGAQVLFDGSADIELKLPSYITVNIEGSASTSYEVKTVRNASNATYYLTFVDSDNNVALSGTSPSEKLYTTPNISINPNTGAVTGTGLGTFNRIKIANESAVKHIEFSRGGVNYITAPASGSIAFATNGKAATAAGTDVIIEDALLAPGNSSVGLGSNEKRWGSLFTNTANLSGQLTSTVAGGHTNHANPDSPVAPTVAGNSPFVVTSSKKNDNLNADLLDDYHANELLEKFDVTLDGDKLNIIIKVGGKEITRSIDIWGDLSNTGVLNAPRVPVTVNGTLNQQS